MQDKASVELPELGLQLTAPHLAAAAQLAQRVSAMAQGKLAACVVLNTWGDNPLAKALEAHLPALAEARVHVPDGYFLGQEDEAPQLVPLPQPLLAKLDAPESNALRYWLQLCIAEGWSASEQRLVPNHFCAIVWGGGESDVLAQAVAEHWVGLGLQKRAEVTAQGTTQDREFLFRFQDPRVMQAVWSRLDVVARKLWMGPLQQWWAVPRQWGPIPQEVSSSTLCTGLEEWFVAIGVNASAEQLALAKRNASTPPKVSRLFTAPQWSQAHASQPGNQLWQALTDMGMPASFQPNGNQMDVLLAEGAGHGLNDQNLMEFALCTWTGTGTSSQPQKIHWAEGAAPQRLRAILDALESDPDLTFGAAFARIR